METPNEELWRMMFGAGHPALQAYQRLYKRLPSPPRCRLCFVPFRGAGGAFMRIRGRRPSSRNPHYCNKCDGFIRTHPGGAEVELSVVFVDVRGSTSLAEKMSPIEYGRAISKYYAEATRVLNQTDGFLIDFVGDAVEAVYPPGFTGLDHARKAVFGATRLLELSVPAAQDGSMLQLGVGVHTGPVYIGTVDAAQGDIEYIRALGDTVNVAARLAGVARAGEALISDVSSAASGLDLDKFERSAVDLKGKSAPVFVRTIRRADSATMNQISGAS